MPLAHYCHKCDLVLKPYEIDTDVEFVTSEHFGQVATTQSVFDICGACGSDVEEVCACISCESALPLAGSDLCSACELQLAQEESEALSILTPL